MDNTNYFDMAKNLQKMFAEKLPYFNNKDFKVMSKTFEDMQFKKFFENYGVNIEETDDKVKYFTEFSKALLDNNRFDTRFSNAMLLDMVAIERAVINARYIYISLTKKLIHLNYDTTIQNKKGKPPSYFQKIQKV